MSFAGAVNPDGCGFCCEFLCQMTPTPTPFIDDLGREVIVRPSGSFLFVVEGRPGSSNRPPGRQVYPFVANPSDRGDLQILVSRPTGEPNTPGFGSAAICDAGPPPIPFGGVPGINPPDFANMSTQATAAIQDMACRFVLKEEQEPCTRNNSGAYRFRGAGSVLQYCYQVPISGEFQNGDTLIAIQLRDNAGNIGPKKEFVLRVE